MTTPADLNFVEPVGSDMVSTGDDDIATNARASAAMFDRLKLERRVPVSLVGTADMNTYTRPDWYRRASVASGVANRPQGFGGAFEFITGEIAIDNSNNEIGVYQLARTADAGSESGRVAIRYGRKPISSAATWGQWQMEHGFMTLGIGNNLDDWKHPTRLEATSQAVSRSIVNKPPWFLEQAVYEVHRSGSTIFQTGICWDANGVKTAIRRSAGGVFGTPWIDTSPQIQLNDTYLAIPV